jgi:hypothetical protein
MIYPAEGSFPFLQDGSRIPRRRVIEQKARMQPCAEVNNSRGWPASDPPDASRLRDTPEVFFPSGFGVGPWAETPHIKSSTDVVQIRDSAKVVLDHSWIVVQTLARNEKALANDMIQLGIPFVLPMTLNPNTGSLLPLFEGILFAACGNTSITHDHSLDADLELYRPDHQILDTLKQIRPKRVFNFIFTSDQYRLRREIALLAAEPAHARTARIEPTLPRKGQPCRFIEPCPYAGLKGIIDRAEPPTSTSPGRVFVLMAQFGQPISTETTRNRIELL